MSKKKEDLVCTLDAFQKEKVDKAIKAAAASEAKVQYYQNEAAMFHSIAGDMIALITGEDPDTLEYDPPTGEVRRLHEKNLRPEG